MGSRPARVAMFDGQLGVVNDPPSVPSRLLESHCSAVYTSLQAHEGQLADACLHFERLSECALVQLVVPPRLRVTQRINCPVRFVGIYVRSLCATTMDSNVLCWYVISFCAVLRNCLFSCIHESCPSAALLQSLCSAQDLQRLAAQYLKSLLQTSPWLVSPPSPAPQGSGSASMLL
jgi:hypothetical protein